MTYNTPGSAKKHRESTEPESCQTAKRFLSSSSSSDGLVENFETLSQAMKQLLFKIAELEIWLRA